MTEKARYIIYVGGAKWHHLDQDVYFRILKADILDPHEHTFIVLDSPLKFEDGCEFVLARKQEAFVPLT